MIPALISGGMNAMGNIAQGAMNTFNQSQTNQMQIDLANTAIQRRAADLQKAGIHPLMAGRMGGAETPTLQAPHMTGIDAGIRELTPNAIQQKSMGMQQQQMEIAQTQAQTENIKAMRDKAIADAALTNTTREWYAPKAKQEMSLQGAQETESKARTATIELTRIPQVNQIVAEIAKKTQETKTEEQRTIEAQQAANNAARLYKARANEAWTIAEQAADYYANWFRKEQGQNLDKRELEIDLLNNENFALVIKNILDNEYGRSERWVNLYNTPTRAAVAAGSTISGSPLMKPIVKYTPERYHNGSR